MLLPAGAAQVRQGAQHQALEAGRLRLPRVRGGQGTRAAHQTFILRSQKVGTGR